MISRYKLQYILLGLASALTLVMVFATSRTLVVLEITFLSVWVLSLVLVIRHWKIQEAIRSALGSIILAAGAIISYKMQHSGALLLVPGTASALFAFFAVREFRSQKAGGPVIGGKEQP
jgi:hypothetical protein